MLFLWTNYVATPLQTLSLFFYVIILTKYYPNTHLRIKLSLNSSQLVPFRVCEMESVKSVQLEVSIRIRIRPNGPSIILMVE